MKDRNYLIGMYNATSTEHPNGSDEIETYEHWLERQLIKRINVIEEHESKAENLPISDVVERISRMKDDSGREGCTYGDTDYDSISVVYGYNMAIDDISDVIGKM